jgi:aconitate hydratase
LPAYTGLVNFGILPLTFAHGEDCDAVGKDDMLLINDVIASLGHGRSLKIVNETKDQTIEADQQLSKRQIELRVAGSLISYLKARAA